MMPEYYVPSVEMRLAQAQSDVEEIEKRIDDQIVLIERLAAEGHDTDAAEHLLATLINLMDRLTCHRHALEREAEERSENAN